MAMEGPQPKATEGTPGAEDHTAGVEGIEDKERREKMMQQIETMSSDLEKLTGSNPLNYQEAIRDIETRLKRIEEDYKDLVDEDGDAFLFETQSLLNLVAGNVGVWAAFEDMEEETIEEAQELKEKFKHLATKGRELTARYLRAGGAEFDKTGVLRATEKQIDSVRNEMKSATEKTRDDHDEEEEEEE